MNKIPTVLIYSRPVLGLVLVVFSAFHVSNYNRLAVILFTVGLLTDILDGIIARYLKISTEYLRRLDSTADQIFFILVAIATYIASPQFFHDHYIELTILLSTEAFAYLICYFKFRKEIATHAISSKIWTLILFATIVQIMATDNSIILFEFCFYVGIITRLEIIAIILILPKWASDVPSVYHAMLLRQGKPIKRHRLFNG